MLEFGLDTFGDVTTGTNGERLPQAQVIRNLIEEAVLADELGIDFFGIGEHHRPEFAVSSPEVVLAAIGGRTKRIRLGSATTVLSTDDPVRVFQRFSTLHAATSGRAEVILGRGWFTESFSLFGYGMPDYDALFDEKLDLFATLIRRNPVSWHGTKRPSINNRTIYPELVGAPLKTWVAVGSTPESALRAARYEMPMMLAVIGGDAQRFKPLVELYKLAFEKAARPMQPVGVHSAGYVAETDAQACEEFWPDYKLMRDRIGLERGWPKLTRATFDLEIERGSLYVGSAETVARKMAAAVKVLGASRFNLKYSMGTLSHNRLLRSVELYATRVVPLVRDILS